MLKNNSTTILLSLLLMILSMPVLSKTTMSQSTDTASTSSTVIPGDIETIITKPMYKNATWGLRVLNLETGKEVLNLNSDTHFYRFSP